jgi:hypothetical protein
MVGVVKSARRRVSASATQATSIGRKEFKIKELLSTEWT